MVNRHLAYWGSMSTGKYDFEPSKLEEDIKAHQERYERKKETIEAIVHGLMKSDPVRQEETFSLFVEVLRDWREQHDR